MPGGRRGRKTLPPHLHPGHGRAVLSVTATDSVGHTYRIDVYANLTMLAKVAWKAIASLEDAEAILGDIGQHSGLAYGETTTASGAFLIRATRTKPVGKRAKVGSLELEQIVEAADAPPIPTEGW